MNTNTLFLNDTQLSYLLHTIINNKNRERLQIIMNANIYVCWYNWYSFIYLFYMTSTGRVPIRLLCVYVFDFICKRKKQYVYILVWMYKFKNECLVNVWNKEKLITKKQRKSYILSYEGSSTIRSTFTLKTERDMRNVIENARHTNYWFTSWVVSAPEWQIERTKISELSGRNMKW